MFNVKDQKTEFGLNEDKLRKFTPLELEQGAKPKAKEDPIASDKLDLPKYTLVQQKEKVLDQEKQTCLRIVLVHEGQSEVELSEILSGIQIPLARALAKTLPENKDVDLELYILSYKRSADNTTEYLAKIGECTVKRDSSLKDNTAIVKDILNSIQNLPLKSSDCGSALIAQNNKSSIDSIALEQLERTDTKGILKYNDKVIIFSDHLYKADKDVKKEDQVGLRIYPIDTLGEITDDKKTNEEMKYGNIEKALGANGLLKLIKNDDYLSQKDTTKAFTKLLEKTFK